MELILRNANPSIPLWKHFLLTRWVLAVEEVRPGGPSLLTPLLLSGANHQATLQPGTKRLTLRIEASLSLDGSTHPLLAIRQDLAVDQENQTLQAMGWSKASPKSPTTGVPKGSPPAHPLLRVTGNNVVDLDLRFVDVTEPFLQLHGRSSWLAILDHMRRKSQTIRTLASLGGHPMIWHVVIPDVSARQTEVKPVVLVMPYDYGAIEYTYDLDGFRNPYQGTSMGSSQSALEILARVLLSPLTDEDYRKGLDAYTALRKRLAKENPKDVPPPFHHFRPVLACKAEHRSVPASGGHPADYGGDLDPYFWSIPTGLERALEETQSVLFFPAMNLSEGGVFVKPGVHALLKNAVDVLYSQTNALTAESASTKKPVLVAFSESGGTVFTAAGNDATNIRGLILLEVQYMNERLGSEKANRYVKLGKEVIPELLKNGTKVVVIGRYVERPYKYLPNGSASGIETLPNPANYHVFAYPVPSGGIGALHKVIARRYARLLDKADVVPKLLLGDEAGASEDATVVNDESKVQDVIDRYRKKGMSDEAIVRAVLAPAFEFDGQARYYPHSLTLTAGQAPEKEDKPYNSFIHDALIKIYT